MFGVLCYQVELSKLFSKLEYGTEEFKITFIIGFETFMKISLTKSL